ncbi:hypothetical protein POM88_047672 [Heracleum sosnowskyi]|uniref:Uncharacterized protein n=1 Tax=Heracleum sosnowskyi TaxID=360622 RepID=A0AAD8GUS3_9APIA|nr:hypothetical protein POM88_047672 [Heracleum sosnowskyi]
MRGYNILLAHPANASDALFLGAKTVWQWTSLLSGGFPLASGEIYPKRYDASLKLRNLCLRNFRLGKVQQIVNMIIAKGWIFPFPDGWKPVSITLPRRDME